MSGLPDDTNAHKSVKIRGAYINPWASWTGIPYLRFVGQLAMQFHRRYIAPDFSGNLRDKFPSVRPDFYSPTNNNREIREEDEKPTNLNAAREKHAAAELALTWLGHATMLIRIDGFNVLCDPVFSEQLGPIGPKRFTPPPCKIEELPEIDAIVISHNHYDHCDVASIAKLGERFPGARWFVPMNDRQLICNALTEASTTSQPPLLPSGEAAHKVTELDWWDEVTLKKPAALPISSSNDDSASSQDGQSNSLRIVFTPTQHWSGRTLITDKCRSLWGSWAIIGSRHRAWFGGDTGYCSVFPEIGRRFGPFDAAAIPIGAYYPRNVFCAQHVDPCQAVQIHRDIQSKCSIGIHWGTFCLTSEPILEPKFKIAEEMNKAGLEPSEFRAVLHGETVYPIEELLKRATAEITK